MSDARVGIKDVFNIEIKTNNRFSVYCNNVESIENLRIKKRSIPFYIENPV